MGKFDYLITEPDTSVLKNLSEMGAHLEELEKDMLDKEAEYQAAKTKFEHYKNTVLPEAMYSAGVTSLGLMSGNSIKVKTEYHCSPTKAARQKLVEWLREHGGDYLIDTQAIVPGAAMGELVEKQIPFIEQTDMNTNKVKSFLKGLIGDGKGGVEAQMEIADIPKEFNFVKLQVAEIEVPKK